MPFLELDLGGTQIKAVPLREDEIVRTFERRAYTACLVTCAMRQVAF